MKKKTDEYSSTRIWARTHQKIKLVMAATGESAVEVLDRLVDQELKKLHSKIREIEKKGQKKEDSS